MESFHPETKKNILQKSIFLEIIFKIAKKFKGFFIAKGSLPFSKFWNPEEECLGLRVEAEAETEALTEADAEGDPGYAQAEPEAETEPWGLSFKSWAWDLELETPDLSFETWRRLELELETSTLRLEARNLIEAEQNLIDQT